MAFYDWSKNVPTSLPTLGGTQPQRSTWSTPTQEGVQASLPSTKLPWSVAEEEDEDDLRKKVAALPWNQPTEQPKKEVPSSGYVHQTKEEIQRKYGFTPVSDIPTGIAYVGERAKQSGIEQLRSTIGIPQRMVSFMKSVWKKIAGDEDNALNQVLQMQEKYEAGLEKSPATKAVESLLPYQQRSEQRIAKAEASGAIGKGWKFAGDVATVPAQQVGFLIEAATGIPVGSLSVVSSYVGKELDAGGDTEDILSGGVKGVVSGQIEKRFFNLFSFLSPAGKAATGIFNKIASKAVPASVAKSPLLSVLSHVLSASAGEGVEEWVNTYTDEIVDWRIKNPDAPIGSWLNRQTLSEANYSALVGAASGALLSSTRYLRGSQRTVDDQIISSLTKDVASIPVSDIENPENVQKVELLNHVLAGKAANPQADAAQLIQEYLDQKSQPQPEIVTPRKVDSVPNRAENIVLDERIKTVVYRDETTGNFVIVEPVSKNILGDDWVLNNAVTQVRSILDNTEENNKYYNLQVANPDIVTSVTEPIVSAGDATTSDLGAEQASVTTPIAETPVSARREATAPSINLSEASVISSGTSTGDVYKIGNKVYKKTTYRSTGNKTLEAEVYSSLSEISEIATANFVNINGEQYIETPYFPIVVSVDTVPKDKRTRYQRAIAQNTTRITAAVEALSNAGYKYNDPLQFGYDSDGNFYLMDFSNASKETGELYDDSAIEENYGRLADFYNTFGLERLAKIVSTSMKFKSVLEDSTAQEVEDREVLLSDEDYEVARQLKRSGGEISPNNAYYATNGRFIAIDGIAQSEPVDGTKYVYSEVQIAPSAVREWEITPIYEKKEIKHPKEAPTSEPETAQRQIKSPAVHYGDLGKSEFLSNQTGSRGTGHFGTGTYFVSPDSEALSRMEKNAYGKRPKQFVSLDGYNLYKPSDRTSAGNLHKFLSEINNKLDIKQELKPYEYDAFMSDVFRDYNSVFPRSVRKYGTVESLSKRIEELKQYAKDNASKDTEAYFKKTKRLDSASTLFMKEHGYDGVDVRGIKGYDDEQFGTVVYDYKSTQSTQHTEQRAPVQEKARVSIKKETVSGRDRLSAKFDRSVSGVEKDMLAASGVKYDEKTDGYYTGTDLTSRKLFESAIESLDVENLDEVIDSVNEMFEEPTGGIFSSKKGTLDLGAKNDAKTGYDGIENDIVAERIEKASFFVPQQKQGKGFLGELVESWQRFTRGGIDIDRRYGDIRAAIFRLRNSRGAAATAIKMTLLKTVNKLSQDQYKLLSHAFVFRDMIEDISLGTVNMNDLPFGYGSDIDGLLKQAQSIEELLKNPKNKVVTDTIRAMQDAMDVMRQRVIKGAAKVGGDLSFLNSRKEYMTHAVIEYIEEIKKTGKRTAEKFYQRYGTNKDYITDPTIAYFIAMQKLYRMDAKNNLMFQVQKHDVAKDFVIKSGDDAGTLGEIPDGYSILNKETLGIKIEKTAQKTMFEEKIKSRRSLWDARIAEVKAELQAQVLNGATEAEQERLNKRIAQMERTRDHDDAMLKEQLGKMEHENYVLPSEIVEAIQEEYKHDVKKEMLIGRVGKAMTGLFKRNALVNPTQVGKYNTKNMFGDFEAMLATYPEGIKKVPQAVNELWNGLVLNKQTKFFEEWVRAGQMDSGLMSTSLEELNNSTRVLYDKAALNNKQGAAKVATKIANVWHKYWEGASSVTSFREQILRYATALAVHEEIQKDIKRGGKGLPRLFGTKLANYGASVPVEVLSITDMFERTLLLSNQAIGNYQDVSKLMQTLSKYAIPFGRWLEVNPMRWGRIIKNTMTTDPDVVMEKGEQAISSFAKGAKVGAFTVMKIGKVALSVAMFNLFLLLWNRVFFKEDDDKLPESIKEQSHITLGTFPGTDKVMYFQDLSSFGQFSEMFGLNGKIPFYSDIKRVVNGETTFENFVKESVAQAGGIWVNSFTPFAKTPVEAYLVKGSLFPDPSSPRPIYDVAEHFFAAADLKNVYRTIKGLPVKGGSYLTELSSSLVNSVEAGDAATWDMYSIREDYLKSIGEYKKPTRYEKDAKALAIYYFKQALRYGDNDAAVEYLAKYVQAGGTKKTYNASMNTLDPLFGLKKEQKTGILEWMNEEQKATYERAVQNFEELKELGSDYWN